MRFSLRDCASLGLVEPHLLGVAGLGFGPHPRLLIARPEDREEHGLQPEDAQRDEEDDPPGLHGLVAVGHVSHKGRDDDARDGGKGVRDAHERPGEGRGDVNVVGEEAGIHPADEHGAQGEQGDRQVRVAAHVCHGNQADGRRDGGNESRELSSKSCSDEVL